MRKEIYIAAIGALFLGSCATTHYSMREPNTKVLFNKADFTLSDQVTESASSVKILCIDWARLFSSKTGNIEGGQSSLIDITNVPVIGTMVNDRTANFALYELMSKNPGYDVVFYPQYKTQRQKPLLGLGFIYKKTKVTTTARLGKLNK